MQRARSRQRRPWRWGTRRRRYPTLMPQLQGRAISASFQSVVFQPPQSVAFQSGEQRRLRRNQLHGPRVFSRNHTRHNLPNGNYTDDCRSDERRTEENHHGEEQFINSKKSVWVVVTPKASRKIAYNSVEKGAGPLWGEERCRLQLERKLCCGQEGTSSHLISLS